MRFPTVALISLSVLTLRAQDAAVPPAGEAKPQPKVYEVEAGRRIPLTLLKGISTKSAVVGDPIYLETTFPVAASNRIIIPKGSYVTGTVTELKRAGKVKGRAELRLRLESIILPNGVTRDFRGSVSGIDSQNGEELNRAEGAIEGKGNKIGDFKNVMTGAGYGAMAGAAAGSLATIGTSSTTSTTGPGGETQAVQNLTSVIQKPLVGSAIGMAGGAVGVFTATLFMRGPDAVLAKGADIEMMLDRAITFEESDLTGSPAPARSPDPAAAPGEQQVLENGLKRR